MSDISKAIRRALSGKDPSSFIEIGDVFGNLEVIGIGEKIGTSRHLHYRCRCVCGNIITVPSYRLKAGTTQSCGCTKFKHGHSLRAFGGRSHEYSVWIDMRKRCNDPKAKGYSRYGGRGIKVCERWDGSEKFPNFLEDMGLCPDRYQIDRIDNDGNYSPENCRWESQKNQDRNKSTNVWLEHKGERLILQDWGTKWGVDPSYISRRLKKGLSMSEIEEIVTIFKKDA